jgi:carboxymethylenebutenolidase
MNGHRIDVRSKEGTIDSYTFTPAGRGPWPAVIVYMDAFGIRPQLGEMAQRLADDGYFVVLPNLYHRTGAFPPFDPTQVVVEGPERDRFKAMIMSITDTMVMRDTAAVIEHLQQVPDARIDRMAALGYCMGGGFAVSAAGTFPERIVAAASFHGGSLATDKPDSPHLLAAAIRARLYVGVAEIDPSFSPAQRERLERALGDAGVEYRLEIYQHAKHGFAVNEHPAYDREASERHWRALLRFFGESLSARDLAGV